VATNDQIRRALAHDRTIDITTVGRTSGRPRRIETWFYRAGGRFFLSGSPGKRDWHANLLANPAFTFTSRAAPGPTSPPAPPRSPTRLSAAGSSA
jgi:hypothetical protein